MSRQAELAELGRVFGTSALSNRNLIINGAMQVAQRGTSYSQSPNVGNYHTVDRFSYRRTGAWSGVTSVTLTQESSGGPVGFKNYLRYAPVGSDATTPSDTTMHVQHMLEGLNASQLDWGTSNAKDVTLSFYVRSTVTGTFGVFIDDDAASASDRTMQIQEYTINSANTWERKSLTFSGPTSGTWPVDNGKFLGIRWILSGDNAPSGSGSNTVVSPNSWVVPTTGAVVTSNQSDALTTSSGQTFDITGVQLEVGDTATPFEHRSYGQELALCQRYYQRQLPVKGGAGVVSTGRSRVNRIKCPFVCTMRASPSITVIGTPKFYDGGSIVNFDHFDQIWSTPDVLEFDADLSGLLTADGRAVISYNDTASGFGTLSNSGFAFDAEL